MGNAVRFKAESSKRTASNANSYKFLDRAISHIEKGRHEIPIGTQRVVKFR